MLSSLVGRFRVVGFIEGLSFIMLLFVAMPLKYMAGLPQAVSVVGMLHGVLFVAYVMLALQAKFEADWSWKLLAILLVASLVPFGTFYTDYKYLKTKTDSNRDRLR